MASVLKTVLLLVIVVASALALYLLVPLLKEGWPTRSLWYVFGIVGLLAALMWLWYFLWTRVWRATKQGVYALGLLVPTLPLFLYAYIGCAEAFYVVRAGIFSSRVTISRYHDALLYWPGVEQPVGVHLELEIEPPFQLPGSFLSPKIVVVNPDSMRAGHSAIENYLRHCGGPADSHPCLTAPLSPYRTPATMKEGGPIRLVYDLFSANLDHLEDPVRICLKERAPTLRIDKEQDVRALWLLGSEGDVVIDLGEKLTEQMHRVSGVQWTPETLRVLYLALREDTLMRAGYRSCDLHRQNAYCYCRL